MGTENEGATVICPECGQNTVYKDGRCKRCFAFSVWKTNTSPDNMGIILFFKQVIPKAFKDFKYGVPYFHKEILYEALRDQEGWTFAQRQIAIAAPRGSSKTTLLSKGLVLFCALFGIKKYIVISSKTGRAASKNLRWIKQALGSSRVISLFGDIRPDSRGKRLETDTIEGKWASDIVVLRNGVTIEAVGMGQQLRSAAEGEDVNRIDLFLADDTETDENTKTPERRETNEVWLFETVLPSLDVDTGTIIFINTQTHTQSILSKLLNANSGWRKKFYQITYRDGLGKELPLWKEKFSPEIINAIRTNYELIGRVRSFYKEYYNIIQSDEGFSERWIRYWQGRVFTYDNESWLEFTTGYSTTKELKPAYLTLGIDLAFSESTRADYCVLMPLAQIHDRRKFILPYSRGRYSIYDEFDESGRVIRKGVVSEAVRLHQLYGFDAIVIGSEGPQIGTFKVLKEALQNCSSKVPRVIPYVAVGEKFARLKDKLQPEYEIGNIHHTANMDDIKIELISFGDTTDDILDSLFDAMHGSRAPHDGEFKQNFGREENYTEMYNRDKIATKRNWMVL